MAEIPAGEPAAGAVLDAAASAVAASGPAGHAGHAGHGGHRRRVGLAGTALGVVAATAAAGVAIERLTVHRGMRRKARLALDTAGPYGTLRGTPGEAVADDGTVLHYEVHEAEAEPAAHRRRRLFGRRGPGPLTVVFCHGYCLNQDSFHFQRAALNGVVRMVHWDQRSHGRSQRGMAQADGVPVTIDQLGRDLRTVLDAAVPQGPVVLVGHSMGGMTLMALAAHYPEYVRERVAGVAFIGTSAGGLGEVNYGLPVAGVNAVRRVLPGVLRALGSRVDLVERSRRAAADLFTGIVKRYSFGSRNVDPAVARFAERMIESTPIDVVAEFYPAFQEHDKTDALAVFAGLPALVLSGDRDLVTPASHGQAIADALPDAELVLVPDAGHLVMLEHPDTVNDRLAELITRAGAVHGTPRRRRPHRPVRG
ncbi:alpha/beta hydrolase [Streptomyces sp. F63]|uniref:alpha/beta fold hydrolase n=1 Tax=Streptomyces sp. F63 TaxID=2824887 RepID=UPI001B35A7A2|nr:alpha/beta hydrolase [Streptomyces sp. F63]MBQ0988043.1 alpha/beta hydrolase [Streptomyces sp. F63]